MPQLASKYGVGALHLNYFTRGGLSANRKDFRAKAKQHRRKIWRGDSFVNNWTSSRGAMLFSISIWYEPEWIHLWPRTDHVNEGLAVNTKSSRRMAASG
jgi:hypothetical protein